MQNIKKLIFILSFGLTGCLNLPDYKTEYGLDIYLGQENKPSLEEINSWTATAIKTWHQLMPEWDSCVDRTLKVITVTFEDKYPLVCNCGSNKELIFANGYINQPEENAYKIFIANKKEILEGAFIHEIGHAVVFECAAIWQSSHQFFKDIDYGY